jgi:hypothetical protein
MLNVFNLSVIMLSVTFPFCYAECIQVSFCSVEHNLIFMLNVIIISVIMLSGTFTYCYAECIHSKCHFSERHISLL